MSSSFSVSPATEVVESVSSPVVLPSSSELGKCSMSVSSMSNSESSSSPASDTFSSSSAAHISSLGMSSTSLFLYHESVSTYSSQKVTGAFLFLRSLPSHENTFSALRSVITCTQSFGN